jgi:hypothetical protein
MLLFFQLGNLSIKKIDFRFPIFQIRDTFGVRNLDLKECLRGPILVHQWRAQRTKKGVTLGPFGFF